MSPKPRKLPAYRLHKPSRQAVVRLDGRDHYLGTHGTSASREKYERLIAEWLTSRTRSPAPAGQPVAGPRLTIHELVLAFWRHAQEHYRDPQGHPTGELNKLRDAIRPLRQLYGETPADAFGPLALRAVRAEMVRSGLSRTTVNARVNRIRRLFRWATSQELVSVTVAQALGTLSGLQRWRTEAPEPEPIAPVPIEDVERVLPLLSRPVAAMVQLQLLTGCRTEEVLGMRGRELTPRGATWEYRPGAHKNAWRGQSRVIVLGPQAQAVVGDFFRPDDPDAFLFSPGLAVLELHAGRARKTRPTPSEQRRRCASPGQKHGRQYTRRSYRQAIVRACGKANITPWTPLQLRHAAATRIRERFGLEAAQVILGHARMETTELDAEKNSVRAHEVMRVIG